MAADDHDWPNLELQNLRGSLGLLQARMKRPGLTGRRRGTRAKPNARAERTEEELFEEVETDLEACVTHPYNQPVFVASRNGSNTNAIGPMRLLHKKMLSLIGSDAAIGIIDGDIEQLEDLLSLTIRGLDPEHPFVKLIKEVSEPVEQTPEPVVYTGRELRKRKTICMNVDEMFDEAFGGYDFRVSDSPVQSKKPNKNELEDNGSFKGSEEEEEDEDEGEDEGEEEDEEEGEDVEMVEESE